MSKMYKNHIQALSFNEFIRQTSGAALGDHSLEDAVAKGLLTQEVLDQRYQDYQAANFFDLTEASVDLAIAPQLSEECAYKFKAVVLDRDTSGLVVGFVDPMSVDTKDEVESILGAYFTAVLVKEADFRQYLRKLFRKVEKIKEISDGFNVKVDAFEAREYLAIDNEVRVAELVNLMIQDAVEVKASDVHIEKNDDSLQVRVRVDGVLECYDIDNYKVADHLFRYLKLLADVDVTQTRLPEDGKKIQMTINGAEVNLRISFMPTFYGFSIVIRLLDSEGGYSLESKISDQAYIDNIREYINRSQGMFIISGPTGSGKTTTLYSALMEVDHREKKVITLEDPVEAKIKNVSQIQINEQIDYGYAKALRASLRQDPDVLLVSEIRDETTAMMAVRAAITGHMVMATVHTRNVIDIAVRLLNLGVDPFLLSSALRLMVSQRLVKKICLNCKVSYTPSATEQAYLRKRFPHLSENEYHFSKGEGCQYCQHTGFSGRTAICELLHLDAELISLLASQDLAGYIEAAQQRLKGALIIDKALHLALEQTTTLETVISMDCD